MIGISAGDVVDVTGSGVVANLGSALSISADTFNISDGARLVVGSGLSLSLASTFNIDNGGALELGSGLNVNLGSTVNFGNTAGSSGTLILDQGLNLNLLSGIADFAAGDSIVFGGETVTSVNWTQNTALLGLLGPAPGGSLLVNLENSSGSATTDTLTINTGTFTNANFNTENGSLSFACFVSGTGIDQPDGGTTAVEDLRIGDQVQLASGKTAAVKWIGRRTLLIERHPRPEMVRPIRILAGAISKDIPRRDVLMSPDHALFLQGGLTPVRLLVNGATIRPDDNFSAVTYYHVELESHAVLLVDGLPAESYLDTGNRSVFENSGDVTQIHPDFEGGPVGQAQREAQSCAPFVADIQQVEPLWRALADRAVALGHKLPAPELSGHDPEPHLMVAGVRVQPVCRSGDCYTFIVPTQGGEARLVSHAMVPSALEPWREDRRRLGVMVASIALIQGRDVERIPPDHPRLRDGWWDAESDGQSHWRWTDGSAALGQVEGRSRVDIVMKPLPCGYVVLPKMERIAAAA